MYSTTIPAESLRIEYRFEITPKIINQITAIAEWRGFVQGLELFEAYDFGDIQKHTILEEAVASVCIEGATIGMKEARTLWENRKDVEISELSRDQRELLAYIRAMDLLEDFRDSREQQIRESDIRGIHRIITEDTIRSDFQGIYRKEPVVIGDRDDTGEICIRHQPPPAEEVPALMRGLVEWLEQVKAEKNKLHAAIVAALAHYELVRIHPFMDGNGRTTRLLATLLLLQRGYDFKKMFCITEYYNRNRDEYYNALGSVAVLSRDNDTLVLDATQWLHYFLGGLAYQVVVAKKRVRHEV